MKSTAVVFVSVFFLLSLKVSSREQPAGREVRAVRIPQIITIDGRLDESAWEDSGVITKLIQREPNGGEPATEPTEIRLLYNDEFLYIGALCFDSQPGKVVANEMRRDEELRHNDFFNIFIDTYHDHRNALYFVTNPLGAKRDGLIREEGSNLNTDRDGLWYMKTQRTLLIIDSFSPLGEPVSPHLLRCVLFYPLGFDSGNMR